MPWKTLFLSVPRLYIVIIVMVLVVTLLLCSFLAFLFFEKPYQCIMAEDEPNRIKFLDEEDQVCIGWSGERCAVCYLL